MAYLELLEMDDRFRTDSVYRTGALNEFVDTAKDDATVAPSQAREVADEIVRVFGSTNVKVRCRSSSNFEDIVPFNGAGLYRSTSGCAADSLDSNTDGPSRCDASISNERSLERAFRRVWSSLWLPRAFNERDFWQAPQERAKMGILVTPAFDGEAANGVIVTGNPSRPGDDRFVINVQLGEESVVSPRYLPEKVLIETDDSGVVTGVTRVRPSTLVAEGEWILSEDEATRVGELAALALSELRHHFETDLGDVLLDLEFKVVEPHEPNNDGTARRIVFKQMRPFLREASDEADLLALVVPPETEVCGIFQEFRSLEEEFALLATARLIPGRIEIPARAGSFDGDIVGELLVGPDRTATVPVAPGSFTCAVTQLDSRTVYECAFTQDFVVADLPLSIALKLPALFTDTDGDGRTEHVLDEAALAVEFDMVGRFDGRRLKFASCSYSFLPDFETQITATTGETATLRTPYLPPFVLTGPENLTAASVNLGGGQRSQTDYWRLVHSADHHNWNRRFWIFLDPPAGDAHVVELREETHFTRKPPEFRLLDATFGLVRELTVASWNRIRVQSSADPEFTRVDATGDGRVNVNDAIRILEALFKRAAPLACQDAADANDDGRLTISDPTWLLLALFSSDAGFRLPWPTNQRCGRDRSPDALELCGYDVAGCPK